MEESWNSGASLFQAYSIGSSAVSPEFASAAALREMAALRESVSSLLAALGTCAMCGKPTTEAERVVIFCSMCREVLEHVRAKAFDGMGKELIKMLSQDDA